MFELFTPSCKVQKDRQVIHDTDARVAKYSRRGLILNFLVFALSLVFGGFFARETNLAVVLVTGLLLVTLLRSYYLFRFEILYSRAPRRWRTQYFLASFLGAIWWSVILVSLTWVLGMRDEALIMWLYTVVFYSSVANVFSPYIRFLKIYLFIGMIPAAVTALMLATVEGALYASIMVMFYVMLVHQAKVTGSGYWERLEVNFILDERARGLENEQKSSRAAIDLKNEFLVNLGHEFRVSLNDILGTLSLVDNADLSDRQRDLLSMATKAGERQLDLVNNVVDFSKITTKSLELDESVFDLRRLVSKLVRDFSLEAHQQGVELNYLLDAELPARVKGDAARLRQITGSLLSHALKFSVTGNVFVEVTFDSADENKGELQIVISDSHYHRTDEAKAEVDESRLQEAEQTGRVGIGLAISKGLAECMDGSVHLLKTPSGGNRILINVNLEAISHQGKTLGADQRLRGKRLLLVDLPDRVAMDLLDELSNWGVEGQTVYGYEQAVAKVQTCRSDGEPIDCVIIYNRLNSFNALALSRELAKDESTAALKQIIAMSVLQRDTDEVQEHLQAHRQVSCLEKPIIYKQLYEALSQRLVLQEEPESDSPEPVAPIVPVADEPGIKRVLVVEDHRVNQMVASGMLKKLGCYVQLVNSGPEAVAILEKERFDMVLLDSELPEDSGLSAVIKIREQEKTNNSRRRIPVIAMIPDLSEEQISELFSAGFDDQINKPLRYEALEGRVQRWLNIDSASV
ncbi:response regulator [Gilvimarinus sp. SDUM040013]|uniref:histidine kinase n=1 Tax=Gilvimarinus gilvus TaxID=3058038 RepID=A0ABU4RTB7_9GAMM|nr:response regulator [Gilvimarinus sp. SDUM040013]MDO3386975.1 response regulator [Gilvimarinus sp. SDUM040013]MDX6848131.1 response regulator [Gilvimarinus sp. SDUM040013]